MPSWSFFPWNCDVKIPAPLTAPKSANVKTKNNWFTMDTPDISSVPKEPTITLSKRLTKLEMRFCTIIGTAILKVIL